MFGLGGGEVVLLLLLALIFVGPKKIPELAKGLGKGIREFQKAKNEMMNSMDGPEEIEATKNHTAMDNHKTQFNGGNVFETTAVKKSEESISSPHIL